MDSFKDGADLDLGQYLVTIGEAITEGEPQVPIVAEPPHRSPFKVP